MVHELDLIPESYRERLMIRRWCHLFLISLVLLIVLIIIAKVTVSMQTSRFKTQISTLQKDKVFNIQQQQNYNELVRLETRLQKKLEILDGLRGGPAVQQILLAIDRVMNGNVWFTRWSFYRAGELTEVKPQAVQTGYFIIIPQDTAGNSTQQAWKLNTHMKIVGQARNHTRLSAFVADLLKQPEINDVKVIKSTLRSYTEHQVVDFNIVVTINNQFRKNDDL